MSTTDLPPFAAMDEEHEAWQEICRRLRDAVMPLATKGPMGGRVDDVDVNHPHWNPVIDQIRYWGETLHRLRLADPSHDDAAYADYRHLAEHGR